MTTDLTKLLHDHHAHFALLNRTADAIAIIGTSWLACWLYGVPWTGTYQTAVLIATLVFYLAAEYTNFYRSWRAVPVQHQLRSLLATWIATIFALLLLGYLSKTTSEYSRVAVTIWLFLSPAVLATLRVLARAALSTIRKNGHNTRTIAIAGATQIAYKLAQLTQQDRSLGLTCYGIYDNQVHPSTNVYPGCKPVDDFTKLVQDARCGKIDIVYITLPMKEEEQIRQLVTSLADTTATVYYVPDLLVFDLLRSRVVNIGDILTISVYETPFLGMDGYIKRIQDVVLSILILILAAAPMAVIAAAVKLSSPGPVLFKQRRYGLDGRSIVVWKFRTMTVCEDGDHIPQAQRGDKRVTKVGAFLRHTSLDELPQLFNVLRGEMSVVGPRPHAVAHNEQYRGLIPGYMLRHKVKPGITGWAQVNGWRGETDTLEKMQRRVECDLWYIRRWSLWLDFEILLRTLVVGCTSRNAY